MLKGGNPDEQAKQATGVEIETVNKISRLDQILQTHQGRNIKFSDILVNVFGIGDSTQRRERRDKLDKLHQRFDDQILSNWLSIYDKKNDPLVKKRILESSIALAEIAA